MALTADERRQRRDARADRYYGRAIEPGDVRQEAMLGAYRYLRDGGDPADVSKMTDAATGQVVREIGFVIGKMAGAVAGAVETIQEEIDVTQITLSRHPSPRLPETDRRRYTPRQQFRRCLLLLGIERSPEHMVEQYLLQRSGKGKPIENTSELVKFKFLLSLAQGNTDPGHTQFHAQIVPALDAEAVSALKRLRPWVSQLVMTSYFNLAQRRMIEVWTPARARSIRRSRAGRRHRGKRLREPRTGAVRRRGSRRTTSRSAGGGSPPGDEPPGEPDAERARRPGLLGEHNFNCRAVAA